MTNEELKEYYKKYRQEHREKRKEYDRIWRQTHKEEIRIYSKEYREKNKEKLNEDKRLRMKKLRANVETRKIDYEYNQKLKKKLNAETRKTAIKNNKYWSQQDEDLLKRYLKEGQTYRQIAKALGRTLRGVAAKAQRLGL